MKRDSKYFESHREELVGEKLQRMNIEPVLELCTDCIDIRLHWERPLQRQSIEVIPYLQRSVLRNTDKLRWYHEAKSYLT